MTDPTTDPANDPDPTTDPANDPDPGPDDDPDPRDVELGTLRTTLVKLKQERARLRKELEAAKKPTDPAPEDPMAGATRRVQRAGGIAALVDAGVTKDQAKRLVGMIDMSSVDFDEDGDGDFTDAITDLKTLFPTLFQRQPAGGTASRRPPAGGTGTGPKLDRTTDALLKQAGYR